MISKIFILTVLLVAAFKTATSASKNKFPEDFKFGAATASYQVEGAWDEDGKSENIWDNICHSKLEYIVDGSSGDVACDSYHKYKEDVKLLKDLGVAFYRFSVSWSRVLPKALNGTAINPVGIEYYKNLTQELIDNGIEPMVTMFHWDTPEILEDIGGWPNPELEEHFVYYAETLFRELGDQVKLWFTFNEPKQTCLQGYGDGLKAPALKASGIADYRCTHTLLKAHARAYRLYEEQFKEKQKGSVGIVIDSEWFEPVSASKEDQEAAERARQFIFGWYANPIVLGDYPQVMIDRVGKRSEEQGYPESRLPKFTKEEIEYIKGTYDFLAINHYTTTYAAAQDEADSEQVGFWSDLNVKTSKDEEWETTAASWLQVVPWGIRRMVNWVSDTYNQPEIFITENGYADKGEIEDEGRVNYYREYLSNLVDAIVEDEVKVTRYTAWSLMDNFEWTQGYSERFGIHYVNFSDPERPRTQKASAKYYTEVIKTRCLVDSCE